MQTRRFLVFIFAFTLILSLNIGVFAVDSDGDGVPNTQDQYPRRNDNKYGGELILAKSFEPLSLSPLKTNYGDMIHSVLDEPTILRDPWGNYVKPGWLESYDISEDGKTWTFYIKEGITFHDGETLDAKALAWQFRERKGTWRDEYLRFIPKENIKVIDKYTMQFQGTKPNPNLKFKLSTPAHWAGLQTPNATERYGEGYGTSEAYGNGPFKLKEWVHGDHMTFERYEKYDWGPGFASNPGPAYLEEVKFIFVPEASTRVEMLRTGEVDGIVEVPFERVEEIQKMKGVNLFSVPGSAAYFAALNTTKPPLNEVKVRKALATAINRSAIAKKIFYGRASPAYSLYLNKSQELPTTKKLYEFDQEKAKEMLADAGWVDNNGDQIREKNGNDLEFSLWTSNKTEFRRLGTILQAYWREIGAKVDLQRMEEATLRSRVSNNEHEVTIWQHLWYGLDQLTFEFDPENKWYPNQSGYEPSQELIDSFLNASNWDEWTKRADDLANHVYEKAPVIRIVRPDSLFAIKDNFKNVKPREGWWSWLPYFHEVYDAEVAKENTQSSS